MSYVPTDLGFLPGGIFSIAEGVSANNAIAVGNAKDAGGIARPVYWDAGNAIHQLPSLGSGSISLAEGAAACSEDGSVIVGQSIPGGESDIAYPVKWTGGPAWTITALPLLPGATQGTALACSVDGSVIFGWCGVVVANPLPHTVPDSLQTTPCVWVNGAVSALPGTLAGSTGLVFSCNPAGTIAFGASTSINATAAFQYPNFSGSATVWTGGPSAWVGSALPAVGDDNVWGYGDPYIDFSVTANVATAGKSNGSIAVGAAYEEDNGGFFQVYWDHGVANYPFGTVGTGVDYQTCDQTATFVLDAIGTVYAPAPFTNVVATLLPPAGYVAIGGVERMSPDATTVVGFYFNASDQTSAVKWAWAGPPIPGVGGPPTTVSPAILNMANVVVTSLATESPCTVAQYVTPPGVSPAVGLRWSDTRGQTFGNAVAQALGTDPLTQLQWNRTGYARDRVFELFWSAAAKTALNGAFVDVVPWKS